MVGFSVGIWFLMYCFTVASDCIRPRKLLFAEGARISLRIVVLRFEMMVERPLG